MLRFFRSKPYRFRRDFLLKKLPKDSICAEIGVLRGDFSARILEVVRPRELHLIDPWHFMPSNQIPQWQMDEWHESVCRRFERERAAGVVTIHREPSIEAGRRFADAYFDWVYIDGDHAYEAVKRDLETYYEKLKPGGYLTGDDYHFAGDWDDGVTIAVDEFIARGICTPMYLKRNSIKKHSQFMLRKPVAPQS